MSRLIQEYAVHVRPDVDCGSPLPLSDRQPAGEASRFVNPRDRTDPVLRFKPRLSGKTHHAKTSPAGWRRESGSRLPQSMAAAGHGVRWMIAGWLMTTGAAHDETLGGWCGLHGQHILKDALNIPRLMLQTGDTMLYDIGQTA